MNPECADNSADPRVSRQYAERREFCVTYLLLQDEMRRGKNPPDDCNLYVQCLARMRSFGNTLRGSSALPSPAQTEDIASHFSSFERAKFSYVWNKMSSTSTKYTLLDDGEEKSELPSSRKHRALRLSLLKQFYQVLLHLIVIVLIVIVRQSMARPALPACLLPSELRMFRSPYNFQSSN